MLNLRLILLVVLCEIRLVVWRDLPLLSSIQLPLPQLNHHQRPITHLFALHSNFLVQLCQHSQFNVAVSFLFFPALSQSHRQYQFIQHATRLITKHLSLLLTSQRTEFPIQFLSHQLRPPNLDQFTDVLLIFDQRRSNSEIEPDLIRLRFPRHQRYANSLQSVH